MRLQDFILASNHGVAAVTGADTFAATRRTEGRHFYIHRFRDPSGLLGLEPDLEPLSPSDAIAVSRFVGLMQPGTSCFLVEQVPPVVTMGQVWEQMLHQAPGEAVGFARCLLHHLAEIDRRYSVGFDYRRAVLTMDGRWLMLASKLHGRRGAIEMRGSAIRSPLPLLDHLIHTADRIAALRGEATITADQRKAILKLAAIALTED